MATINPYLTFNGNCEEAFNHYKSIFGGEFVSLSRFKEMPGDTPVPDSDKEKIMHMALPISKETILMGSDTFGEAVREGNNFSISISSDSEEEAKRIFNALAAGGTVKMPLEKVFWGDLFGMLTDRFGIHWMMSQRNEQK